MEPAIIHTGAREFAKLIYEAYDAGFHLDAFGLIIFLSCAMLAGTYGKTNTNKMLERTAEVAPQMAAEFLVGCIHATEG